MFVAATAVGSIAASVLVAALSRGRVAIIPNDPWPVLLFSVLLFIAEAHTLQWLQLHDGGEITPSWAFAYSLVLLPAPVMALAVMAAACVVGDLLHRKPLQRMLFNMAQTTLSLATAALVLLLMGEEHRLVGSSALTFTWIVAVTLGALTMFAVNGLLTCMVLALHEGVGVVPMLRRGMFLNFVSDGALVALAPVLVVVAARSVLLLLPTVSIVGLVHYNTRAALASEHEANHDVLTELPNRRSFMSRLQDQLHERNDRHRCALVLIDLDDFKDINDRLGHQTGDMVLSEIGARLRALQQSGHFAARLGGDEFALLVTQFTDIADVTSWADALRIELSRPCISTGFPLSVTLSVGIAVWPDHGRDPVHLFQAADLAMYGAKKTRNSMQLYRDTQAGGAGRIDLLAELETGVQRDQLQLWYQPQIDVRTGTIVGLEALVRWDHPRLGLVLPDDFMPAAEHTDLMGPVTEAIVHMAVRDAIRWRRHFPNVRVAVNTSARNMSDLGFPKFIASVLATHRGSAELLELEITENTVTNQPERTRAVLESLADLGVRLSIDDFGTGFSSLAHMRTLPVHAIKIDRSFVTNIADSIDDQIIVQSIIDLAHNLGMETVAEGVETTASTEFLHRFDCNSMQGFLIARPMPLHEAMAWMSKSQRLDAEILDLSMPPLDPLPANLADLR
jgi:diguanylate cyclase (GGDEF)-like protein